MADKDFINYFRKASSYLDKNKDKPDPKQEPTLPQDNDPPKDQRVEFTKNRINEYLKLYPGVKPEVIRNLIELKDISNQPKEDAPDNAYENIKQRLGNEDEESEEVGETLRQERWQKKVRCIRCGSRNVKRLPASEQKAKNIYKYECLDCSELFNDDSDTEIARGTPPLYSWMFCWYLLGCTTSTQYIANKLKLDVPIVEMMIQHMQKLFKAKQPLNHFLTFDDFLRHGKNHQTMLKDSLQKKDEMLKGYSVGAAKDQHEVDRQTKHRNNPKPKNRGS